MREAEGEQERNTQTPTRPHSQTRAAATKSGLVHLALKKPHR